MRLALVGLLASTLAGRVVPAAAQPVADCRYGPGDLPATTLPTGTPHGSQVPIDHVIVLMQENRSFDHYFGQLHKAGQPKAEGPPKGAHNVDPTGATAGIKLFHKKALCEVEDLDHSWTGTHVAYDGGKMDQFTLINVSSKDPNGSRAMGYYTGQELNFYYKLANTFAIGDRYFCSLLSQTFPNRFFLLAGTSFGHIANEFPNLASEDYTQPTIFNRLDDAGVTWRVYYSQVLANIPFTFANIFGYVRNHKQDHVVPVEQFAADAAAGNLPSVVFVDPSFLDKPNSETDEHPPANVQIGQQFAASIVNAVMASPLWPSSALFITYDEHGGYYDHVAPPSACVPDDLPPVLAAGDTVAAFDQYGPRVPVIVVSPYSRKHFVSHVVHDHTSILRFIETRFDLPALTKRDANADPMLEFFDFTKARFAKPPKLPKPRVNAKKKAECDAIAGAARE